MFGNGGRLGASTVYLIYRGAFALFFTTIATVNLVYQAQVARLTPLQLVLVGTVLEGTAFLCEVPTGVVADLYSRRLSIVIGTFLIGAGFLLEGLVPRFAAILLAQVIWGSGVTFISGAEPAWIADEVGETAAGRAYLRGAQIGQFGTLLGIGASVGLASISLNLPIVVGGVLFLVLGAFLLVAMPERGFRPVPREERRSWAGLTGPLREGGRLVRRRPLLLTILALAACYGMTSEGFDRLWQIHFLTNFTFPALGRFAPVVWFGVIAAGATLLTIGATELVGRRLDTTSHAAVARALLAINAAQIAGTVAFGLAGDFSLALAAYWLVATLRAVTIPLYTAWLNQQLDSRSRATVFSLSGQVDALGQIAGGPAIGALGNLSLRAAMVAAGALLAPALLLYARALRQGGAAAQPVDPRPDE